MAEDRIDENGLPVYAPGDYDFVRVVDRSTGASRNALAPEVTAAARALSGALAQVVADAQDDIAPVIAGLGYLPPVPFAPGLTVDSSRFTVSHGGEVYAPVADALPFTTTETFDPAQWRIIQGVTGPDLASSTGANMVGFSQAGAGAQPRTLGDKLRGLPIDVEDFGAVGDGVADDTAAIQLALNEGAATGRQVVGRKVYRISGKVTIMGNADFGDAEFHVYGSPGIAVEVSNGNGANPTGNLFRAIVVLPKVLNMAKPSPGWSGQGVGVRTVNCSTCHITVPGVRGFATNLLVTAFGLHGNAYNSYYIGWLENGRVNCELVAGDTQSWVTENVFFGGRYSHNGGEGVAVPGTRHILINKFESVPNNNLFIRPSIEGDVCEYHVENGGSFNTFLSARWEATTPKVLYTADNSSQGTRNLILGGYQTERIAYEFAGSSAFENSTINARGSIYNGADSTASGNHKYRNVGSSNSPIMAFFDASVRPESAATGQWNARFSANHIRGKLAADENFKMEVNWTTGRITFGNGVAPATSWVGGIGSAFAGTNVTWAPVSTGAQDLGASALRWRNAHLAGAVGFFSSVPPAAKPAVTGSRGGNAALASLITALASYGLVTDSTTA